MDFIIKNEQNFAKMVFFKSTIMQKSKCSECVCEEASVGTKMIFHYIKQDQQFVQSFFDNFQKLTPDRSAKILYTSQISKNQTKCFQM